MKCTCQEVLKPLVDINREIIINREKSKLQKQMNKLLILIAMAA